MIKIKIGNKMTWFNLEEFMFSNDKALINGTKSSCLPNKREDIL